MEPASAIPAGLSSRLVELPSFHEPGNAVVPLDADQVEAVASFNADVRSGALTFEETDCLCESKDFAQIASVDRHGLLQSTVMCVRCGLIQSNPRLTDEEYELFYRSDRYRLIYEGHDYLAQAAQRYAAQYGDHIHARLVGLRSPDRIGSVLEFGAAGGWNLLPFKDDGTKVVGYDYSEELVKLGCSRGIDLRQGGLEQLEGRHDVVIANHVVEHLIDPRAAIERLASHVAPGGVLYLGVPNIRHFGMGQLQNAHTYYFTPETFTAYTTQRGLRLRMLTDEPGDHMAGVFDPANDNAVRHPRSKATTTRWCV